MKKHLLLFACLVSAVFPVFAQTPDPQQQFVDQVNAKWKLKDYPAIEQLINTRLQSNPSDVLALGTKAYYHFYAVNNLNLSRAAIQVFNGLVQASNNPSAKEVAARMKDEIWVVPLSESGPLPATEQNEFHNIFPKEMPMIRQVLSVERALHPPSP